MTVGRRKEKKIKERERKGKKKKKLVRQFVPPAVFKLDAVKIVKSCTNNERRGGWRCLK